MTLYVASPSEQTKTRQFAHSAAVLAANVMVPVVINAKAYIPMNASDAAADNAWVMEARIKDAPKATGSAWVVGEKIYWDDTAKKFTDVSTSNTLCGYASAAAASGDTTGSLDFDSNAA